MIVRFLAHALALLVATLVLPGIQMTAQLPSTDVAALAVVAVIFGIANTAVKPLFRRFGLDPLALVVLGISLLIANAALLLLTSWIAGLLRIPWHVDGLVSAVLGGLIVGVVSFLVNSLFGRRGEVHR